MMKSISLRTKMIVTGIMITVIPLFIVGSVIFVYLSRSMETLARERTTQLARDMSGLMEAILEEELKVLSTFSADPQLIESLSGRDYRVCFQKLSNLLRIIGGDYESISIADTKGIIRCDIHRERLGINISDRDYFHKAVKGIKSIGSPVFSKATGEPICVIAAPVTSSGGHFVGAVLFILKIDFLADRINALKVGQSGYPFVVNDQGLTILHPRREYVLKHNFFSVQGISHIVKRMIRQETGSERYTFEGVEKIMGYAPIKLTGWSVGAVQDRNEVLAPVRTILNFILCSGAVFLFISVVSAYIFAGRLGAPVQKRLNILNRAIEQSDELFAVIGLDRRIDFVNPAMERIFGLPASELTGREPLLVNSENIPPEDIWKNVESGMIWAGQINGANSNGVPFSAEITITPVRDESGRISGYLGIGRDITHELHMEKQLRQSQKMEAIGTLAGGIAHDFNNILSAIFGYAELSRTHLHDSSRTASYIQGILNAAERARGLVNQILTFSRQAEQEKRPVEPAHVIRETLKLLRASLSTRIEIRESLRSRSLIMGDPTHLNQVVMNLCTNASFAMRENGGLLGVSLDDVVLEEDFVKAHAGANPGPHVKLSVSDTGCGIAPENLDRIFDPFFSTKPKEQGTGLGLSVVHGIVRNMRGVITVSSGPGGSDFTIYLPSMSNSGKILESPGHQELQRGSGRVMLIDDEANLTVIGKEMLERLGYTVASFNDSLMALDIFRKSSESFDIIITDSNMPGMSGLELARQAKSVRSDIPVILCSGHFETSTEIMAEELGVAKILKKPVMSHELASAIAGILGGRASS
jgi:PAS domain S-box-containing protein